MKKNDKIYILLASYFLDVNFENIQNPDCFDDALNQLDKQDFLADYKVFNGDAFSDYPKDINEIPKIDLWKFIAWKLKEIASK